MCTVAESILLASSSQSFDPDDPFVVCVHDRDQWQWVAIEVGVWVAISRVTGETESL